MELHFFANFRIDYKSLIRKNVFKKRFSSSGDKKYKPNISLVGYCYHCSPNTYIYTIGGDGDKRANPSGRFCNCITLWDQVRMIAPIAFFWWRVYLYESLSSATFCKTLHDLASAFIRAISLQRARRNRCRKPFAQFSTPGECEGHFFKMFVSIVWAFSSLGIASPPLRRGGCVFCRPMRCPFGRSLALRSQQ